MPTPRLINLPAPPSDPVTPSGPSTPNSTTTSLSGVSTTAIKDGHQGNIRSHTNRGHRSSTASDTSTTTLDAERADRISRLAGLERVTSVRQDGSSSLNPHSGIGQAYTPAGYFEIPPHLQKERSTVGSASATGSIGGRTTWASGSDIFDADKMGDDIDDGSTSSTGGFSDENASLVGFGEGANSTISGPVSSATPARVTAMLSRQASGTAGGEGPGPGPGPGGPGTGVVANRPLSHSSNPVLVPIGDDNDDLDPDMASPAGSNTPEAPTGVVLRDDARMVDGMTFDANIIDTTDRPAPPANR